MAHRGRPIIPILALAAVLGFAVSAAAEDIRDFTVDDLSTGAELCADIGTDVICKAANEATGGVRPVSAVIDPCTNTIYTGDARGPGGARFGGIRVIQNWFDPTYNPATDDFLLQDPNSPDFAQAGKNGIAYVGETATDLVFLTGDRFNGRIHRVKISKSDPMDTEWTFMFQAIGDEENGCTNPDATEPPGDNTDCIGPGVNNLEIDASGRIWFPITTRRGPGAAALSDKRPDGYIQLLEIDGGVDAILNTDSFDGIAHGTEFFGEPGEGFELANGARVDPTGKWLYMAETLADPPRVVRMRIITKGRGRTVLGPVQTFVTFPAEDPRWPGGNPGPDEIAFDVEGNLYVMLIFANALVVIPRDAEDDPLTKREIHTIFADTNVAALAEFSPKLGNQPITGGAFPPLAAGTIFLDPPGGGPGQVDNPTGLAFGGPDLKRIFITTRGQNMYTFEGPIAGLNPFAAPAGTIKKASDLQLPACS